MLDNIDFDVLIFIRYLLQAHFVKKIFFEDGPLKFCRIICYSLGPFSIALNIYILAFGFRRN